MRNKLLFLTTFTVFAMASIILEPIAGKKKCDVMPELIEQAEVTIFEENDVEIEIETYERILLSKTQLVIEATEGGTEDITEINTEAKTETETETETEMKTEPETEQELEIETVLETEAEPETEYVPVAVVPFSDIDYDNLLRIVEAECTGGDVMSKTMVANVIINRVKSNRFPGNITEVIMQGNGEQFQPVMDGRFYSVNVTPSTVEAVNSALYGNDNSNGALFFASVASAGGWHASHLRRIFEYGGHIYYDFG